MTPDPDDLRVMEMALHVAQCLPGQMPYERYARKHRKEHEDLARMVLASLNNAGKTLTDIKDA